MNAGSIPAARACERNTRAQKPWMVEMNASSVSRAAASAPSSRSRRRIRSRISAAAFSVKVIVRIAWTATPSSSTERTNRSTSTDVLPLPAPASSSRSPSRRSIATSCSPVKVRAGVSGSAVSGTSSTADPGVLAAVARAGGRAGLELAVLEPRRQRQRAAPSLAEQLLEFVLVTAVVGDQAVPRRGALQEHPARPEIASTERLIQARNRLEAQQLADREHVQRDLEPAVSRPARALVLGPGRAALVVAH